MELRHLRYFVAVAETLNVRVASEQLHITQPAISRQIRDLEDTVGAALFTRTPRGLRLTPAGTAYLTEARAILARVDTANRMARRLAAGQLGHIRLGFVENMASAGAVSDSLRSFRISAPDVAIDLQVMNTPQQLEAIQAERLDGGFCYVDRLPDGLASRRLSTQDVVLAVSSDWTLGARGAVTTAQLAGTPFVAFPRNTYPAYHDRLLTACAERGLALDIRQEAATETAILALVSAGVGAAIVNAANLDRPPAGIRFVHISDLSVPLSLEFCFVADIDNPALLRFVNALD